MGVDAGFRADEARAFWQHDYSRLRPDNVKQVLPPTYTINTPPQDDSSDLTERVLNVIKPQLTTGEESPTSQVSPEVQNQVNQARQQVTSPGIH